MTDNDNFRLVELELEDLYAQLRRVRSEAKGGQGATLAQTQELLRISQRIRELAARVRVFSEATRQARIIGRSFVSSYFDDESHDQRHFARVK